MICETKNFGDLLKHKRAPLIKNLFDDLKEHPFPDHEILSTFPLSLLLEVLIQWTSTKSHMQRVHGTPRNKYNNYAAPLKSSCASSIGHLFFSYI